MLLPYSSYNFIILSFIFVYFREKTPANVSNFFSFQPSSAKDIDSKKTYVLILWINKCSDLEAVLSNVFFC